MSFPVQPPVSTAGGVITRTAHVPFEGCNARHITLRVTIAKDPFLIGQAVTYEVSLTNSGATACGTSHTNVPPFRQALTVGPCGELSGVVANAAGLDVYPGKQIFGCPLYWGVHLGANTSIKAEGTWMGYEALSGRPGGTIQWEKAPPGRYSVIVDGAVSVPFQLAGTSSVPRLPAPTPTPTPAPTPLPTPLPNLPRTGAPTPLPPGQSRSHQTAPLTPTSPNSRFPTPTTPAQNLPMPTTPTTSVG